MTPIPRDTPRPTATRRKPPIRRPRPVPEATLLHTLADVLAALSRMLDATITLLRTQGVDDATIIAALREGWTTTMAEVVPDEVRRLAIGGNAG